MSFLGFGRRKDSGLERQRQAIATVSAEFGELERRFAGVPELKASFAAVWQDVPELDEVQAKLPTMRELIGLLQSRADHAKAELPTFDDSIAMLASEIVYAQGLFENIAVTLVMKQGEAASSGSV